MRQRSISPTRTLLAGAALLTLAGTAAAQSQVTLYGRVDLGVQYSTTTLTSDERLVEQSNGGIAPSILGFKGSEDLGGGLAAFFNLESHIWADTGTAAGNFWRRQSNVGLKGDWGTITLGRQYSPALLQLAATEPRGFKEQLSGLYTFAYNQNPAGNPVNDIGVFIGNSASYTGSFGPVGISGLVAAGEGTGKTYSVGASYAGPVLLGLAYQQIESAIDGTESRLIGVGAGAPIGPVTLKGQWLRIRNEVASVRTSEVDSYGIGADYAWGGAHTANVTFYYAKDRENSDDKVKTLILSNDYALSKRTTVYAQVALADADEGASRLTSVIANGNFPDKKTTVVGVGIRHDF